MSWLSETQVEEPLWCGRLMLLRTRCRFRLRIVHLSWCGMGCLGARLLVHERVGRSCEAEKMAEAAAVVVIHRREA